jgi:hypothetical protein
MAFTIESDTELPEEVRNAIALLVTDKHRCSEFLAASISYDMTAPCSDCPFKKSTPFHGGVCGSIPLYINQIEDQRFCHTCHKTDTSPHCDGPVAGQEYDRPTQHCAGAILMLLKTGKGLDLQLPLLKAAEAGKLDIHRMAEIARNSPDIYTLGEFLRFYGRHAAAKAGVEWED